MHFFNTVENQSMKIIRKISFLIVNISVVIVLGLFCTALYGEQMTIVGRSMENKLFDDDIVLIDKMKYNFKKVERFDIIVFEDPKSKNGYLVKRVLGLPGETVQIKDGRLYINDSLLNSSLVSSSIAVPGEASKPVVIGDDEYFVMGDRTEGSEDSRSPQIKNISADRIVGKVWFRISPFGRFGAI